MKRSLKKTAGFGGGYRRISQWCLKELDNYLPLQYSLHLYLHAWCVCVYQVY